MTELIREQLGENGKPVGQASSHPIQASSIRNAAVGNYNCSPNTGNPQLDKGQPPRGRQHDRTWVATHSRNSSTERHRGWPQEPCKKTGGLPTRQHLVLFGSMDGAGSVATGPKTSRAAFGVKKTFLTAKPLFLNATASGLDVHGGSGPPKSAKSTTSNPKCTSILCHLTRPRAFRVKNVPWTILGSCRLPVLAVQGAPRYVTPCMGRLRMSRPVCTTLLCTYWPRAHGRTTTG